MLLEVKNLKIKFIHDKNETEAVHGISFTIKENEILGIVGESGSGKTVTALSIMKLLLESNSSVEGEVIFQTLSSIIYLHYINTSLTIRLYHRPPPSRHKHIVAHPTFATHGTSNACPIPLMLRTPRTNGRQNPLSVPRTLPPLNIFHTLARLRFIVSAPRTPLVAKLPLPSGPGA